CPFYFFHCDLHSLPTRRSSDLEVIAELETRFRGSPAELLAQRVAEEPGTLRDLARDLEFDEGTALEAARTALAEGRLRSIGANRSEEHTSELQSRENLVCRLLL